MKLISEENFNDIEYLTEDLGEGKKTNLYITGVFMEGDKKNRNGRIYPSAILESQMNTYNRDFISKKRSLGELNHPSGPTINLDKVSHMITEMKRDGSNFIGKAKILETPMGNIARNLIESGAALGVSTRGLGTLKASGGAQVVQEDFVLNTVDIVAQPSAHGAWVNGIMENVEWVYDPTSGEVTKITQVAEEIKEEFQKKSPSEEEILESFERYLDAMRG